ncbi:ABC transporter ATP-binding protein [Companilactobacillus ginsenosidimutans]|uniref:Glycosyl transferase family 2 n=1 Tax=Companilactobacillus ginsenosidimutans TaxID=1007676 RepID=A0A0H4QIM4_9LACO|nr:ABC transporter ATP-binding protein [Companilactobacillus ginsenosidimutans]AKP67792.1 glycosyl transferase family 2 [Companilactobacillus ginsenosidimutans]
MAKPIISMKNIVKKFGDQTVLNHVNFDIAEGKIIGLIGPSGAGKSTIIKIILGMEKTQDGTATVFGQVMPNRQLLSRIGYMAQTDALYDALSARENLKFYADMKGVSAENAKAQIEHITKVVDLTDDLDKRVSGYSGGMKRRLSLAIALLGDGEVLILDEPTVGIDPALRRKIWDELHSLRDAGKTILVTTHVMDEAELVDDVALILGGKLIAYDTPANLKAEYNEDTVENVFLKAEDNDEKNMGNR